MDEVGSTLPAIGKDVLAELQANAGYAISVSSQYQCTLKQNTRRALARQGTKLLRWMTPCKKGEELLSVESNDG